MVSTPNVLSWVDRLLSSVAVMRAPVMPNGCPKGDRTTGDVELVLVDAEIANEPEHLHGERLVDLEQSMSETDILAYPRPS